MTQFLTIELAASVAKIAILVQTVNNFQKIFCTTNDVARHSRNRVSNKTSGHQAGQSEAQGREQGGETIDQRPKTQDQRPKTKDQGPGTGD